MSAVPLGDNTCGVVAVFNVHLRVAAEIHNILECFASFLSHAHRHHQLKSTVSLLLTVLNALLLSRFFSHEEFSIDTVFVAFSEEQIRQ